MWNAQTSSLLFDGLPDILPNLRNITQPWHSQLLHLNRELEEVIKTGICQ